MMDTTMPDNLRSGLARWLPRIILAVVFFFIAVDIAPEAEDVQLGQVATQFATQNVFTGRFLRSNSTFIPLNRSLQMEIMDEASIDGSNWWQSCGPNMHSCHGPWLPEEKRYCCCDPGYAFDSVSSCKPSTTSSPSPHVEIPRRGDKGHLLFCSVFDDGTYGQHIQHIQDIGQGHERERGSPTYSEVQSFDEGSLLRWASKIFKAQENQRYAQEWDEALTALESHHVDGAKIIKLTRSEFDSEWNLMNIGLPQGAAEVLTDHIRALKPQLRRLSSGASGCDSDTGSGTSGCDSTPSESSRSSPSQGQALQGCSSESSTGTRGCESSSSSSGTKGCATSRSTGSGAQGCQSQSPKGCQSEHAAKGCHAHAKGCDSGVQGCHSGVCGCQEKSGLGDFLGLLLYLPFILLVTMQAVLAPALLASALLLPALLLVIAFVKGSFFVLLLAGFTAAVWTGVAVFYQRRQEGALFLESSGVE